MSARGKSASGRKGGSVTTDQLEAFAKNASKKMLDTGEKKQTWKDIREQEKLLLENDYKKYFEKLMATKVSEVLYKSLDEYVRRDMEEFNRKFPGSAARIWERYNKEKAVKASGHYAESFQKNSNDKPEFNINSSIMKYLRTTEGKNLVLALKKEMESKYPGLEELIFSKSIFETKRRKRKEDISREVEKEISDIANEELVTVMDEITSESGIKTTMPRLVLKFKNDLPEFVDFGPEVEERLRKELKNSCAKAARRRISEQKQFAAYLEKGEKYGIVQISRDENKNIVSWRRIADDEDALQAVIDSGAQDALDAASPFVSSQETKRRLSELEKRLEDDAAEKAMAARLRVLANADAERDLLSKLHRKMSADVRKKIEERIQRAQRRLETRISPKAEKAVARMYTKNIQKTVDRYSKKLPQMSVAPVNMSQARSFKDTFSPMETVMEHFLYRKSDGGHAFLEIELDTAELEKLGYKFLKSIREVFQNFKDIRTFDKADSALIPKSHIKDGIVDEEYAALICATYFQMLVSNTPVDEPYDYIENRVVYRTGRITPPAGVLDMESKEEVAEAVDREEKKILRKSLKTRKVIQVKHHHEPDEDYIRNDWVLHFKGLEIRAGDLDSSLFEKKSDRASALKLKDIIYGLTKDLQDKSPVFWVENTNSRYGMLEYGGYKRDSNSVPAGGKAAAPWIGSKYGLEHGVKNRHSYQAPNGFYRMTQAAWNVLVTSGRFKGYTAQFVNSRMNKLDVSSSRNSLSRKVLRTYPELKEIGYPLERNFIEVRK